MSKKKHKQGAKKQTVIQPAPKPASTPWVKNAIRWILFGTIFLLPWIQFPATTSHGASYYFVILWLSGVLASLLVYGVITKTLRLPSGKIWIPLSLWLGSMTISTLFSIDRGVSFWGGYGTWSDGLMFALATLVVFLSVSSLEPEESDYKTITILLSIQGVVMSLGVLNEAVGLGLFQNQPVRPNSVLNNSDYFVSYAVLIWPLTALFAYQAFAQGKHWIQRILRTLGSIIVGIALFLTLPTQLQQMVTHQHYSPAPSAVSSGVTSSQTTKNQSGPNFLQNPSNTERFSLWDLGIAIGKQHPLFGTGPGTESIAFFDVYKTVNLGDWNYVENFTMGHPHSMLVEVFASQGYVGLVLYLLLWITFFTLVILAWRRKNIDKTNLPYTLAMGLGLLLYLLFNLFLFTTPLAETIAWIFAAILLRTSQIVTLKPAKQLQTSLIFILGLLALYGTYGGFTYLAAERTNVKANALVYADNFNEAASTASEAADLFPANGDYQLNAAAYNRAVYMLYSKQLTPDQLNTYIAKAISYSERTPQDNPFYGIELGLDRYVSYPLGSKNNKDADALVQQALEKGSDYPYLYVQAADAYYWKGDCDKAHELYSQAIEKGISPTIQTNIAYKEANAPCVPVTPISE